MIDSFIHALMWLFSSGTVGIMAAGAFGGLLAGAIPGLTSTMAIALLIPVTFGMSPSVALSLLVAVYVGAISGGLVSATLLKIPGTPSSVATTFDAYPMARRGEASRALAFGVSASFLGGLLSAIVLAFSAPLLANVALHFAPYEYFSLVVFTLSCIIVVSGKSLSRGLLSAVFGLLLALVGTSPSDGVSRFTFGFADLEAGFSLLPVLIGLYAIPQILSELDRPAGTVLASEDEGVLSIYPQVFRRIFSSWWNALRSSLIGLGIGILPGIGPGLSNVVAYARAREESRDPDSFGTGNPDGIIASEAANNASTGGALIPLLTLGIPGDASTMMMLGAFMIHGIQPGPLLFKENLSLVGVIMAAFFVANILVFLIQIPSSRVLAAALRVPKWLLLPSITLACIVGCYSLNSRMFDVWTFFVFGLIGWAMKSEGYPLLPLVIGLILGNMAETQLRIGLAMSDGSILPFVTRPISGLFLLTALLSTVWSLRKHFLAGKV